MSSDLADLDAVARADAIRRGDVTPLQAVDATLGRIEQGAHHNASLR